MFMYFVVSINFVRHMYMYVLMYSIILMVPLPYDLCSGEKHSFKLKGVGVDAA